MEKELIFWQLQHFSYCDDALLYKNTYTLQRERETYTLRSVKQALDAPAQEHCFTSEGTRAALLALQELNFDAWEQTYADAAAEAGRVTGWTINYQYTNGAPKQIDIDGGDYPELMELCAAVNSFEQFESYQTALNSRRFVYLLCEATAGEEQVFFACAADEKSLRAAAPALPASAAVLASYETVGIQSTAELQSLLAALTDSPLQPDGSCALTAAEALALLRAVAKLSATEDRLRCFEPEPFIDRSITTQGGIRNLWTALSLP